MRTVAAGSWGGRYPHSSAAAQSPDSEGSWARPFLGEERVPTCYLSPFSWRITSSSGEDSRAGRHTLVTLKLSRETG